MTGLCQCPRCARAARAAGLCATHFQQRRRGGPLRAIGPRGGKSRTPGERMLSLGLRVSPGCVLALQREVLRANLARAGTEDAATIYTVAREVLERWARRRI